jgi:hypothetical protein
MSLHDPNWKYTHSTATNIRKTFAKARRELRQQQLRAKPPAKGLSTVVVLRHLGRARELLPQATQVDAAVTPAALEQSTGKGHSSS